MQVILALGGLIAGIILIVNSRSKVVLIALGVLGLLVLTDAYTNKGLEAYWWFALPLVGSIVPICFMAAWFYRARRAQDKGEKDKVLFYRDKTNKALQGLLGIALVLPFLLFASLLMHMDQ